MIKCKILGHVVPSALDPFQTHGDFCHRCGVYKDTVEVEEDLVEWQRFGWMTLPAKWLWKIAALPSRIEYRFWVWCHPCPDCGRRFGLHSKSVSHIPF